MIAGDDAMQYTSHPAELSRHAAGVLSHVGRQWREQLTWTGFGHNGTSADDSSPAYAATHGSTTIITVLLPIVASVAAQLPHHWSKVGIGRRAAAITNGGQRWAPALAVLCHHWSSTD